MKWIDMHCDTLSEIIRQRKELKTNDLCADLERLLRGGAGAQFFACFVNAARYGLNTKDADEKMIWDQAYWNVLSMIGRAKREQNKRFEIAVEPEMIQRQLWAETDESEILYGILTVEEGGVLNGRMERLGELYDRGVRLMTLTWNYTNCIGSPNSRNPAVMEKGLTEFGINVIEQMNDKGMIIDVSHLSDGGFWDCIRYSRAPIAASHSNARMLCRHPRKKGRAQLSDLVLHIRHMVNCAGEDAVALGSDFDGFDPADCPEGAGSVLDVGKVLSSLEKNGFTQRQIEKIARDNVRRLIEDTW